MKRILVSGILMSLASISRAEIVSDMSAPPNQQPTVMSTANGLPQVNIQTPSAAGVSRNMYSQFDIESRGAILNNSKTDVNTQLAGWISGNPNLSGTHAQVILNEVNSTRASNLFGPLEVAGQRAEVVIANPAGLICNGCGSINAHRMTYTTGRPQFDIAGNIINYAVQGGLVAVEGAGMDTGDADYTDIIARAVTINADIWAKELTVQAGASESTLEAKPEFAIDTKALGGMYANKIHLIGTEDGLGVRHAGHLGASVGEFLVTVNGNIENISSIYADTIKLSAKAVNNIKQDTQSAVIGARDLLQIEAATINNAGQSEIVSLGDMILVADTINNVGSTIDARGDAAVQANVVNNLNADLQTSLKTVSCEKIAEYEPVKKINGKFKPSGKRYAEEAVTKKFGDGVITLVLPDESEEAWHYNRYDYTRTVEESVVEKTMPAWFAVGGELTANIGQLINRDSYLNAKVLTGAGGTIDSVVTPGVQVLRDQGTKTWVERKHVHGSDYNEYLYCNYAPTPTTSHLALENSVLAKPTLPTSVLFQINADPTNQIMIETDPRFVDQSQWLSSAYMMNQLGLSPDKYIRLGDAYYEQRLLQQQIIQETGYRYLRGFSDNNDQYLALMNQGVLAAEGLRLMPGIALTVEQIASLTEDIVWLVEKDITMQDGSNRKALVPQFYSRLRKDDIANGAIISGRTVNIALTGDIHNQASFLGEDLNLSAQNIRNTESLNAERMVLYARENIENSGGTISAAQSLLARADNDILMTTTTKHQTDIVGNRTTHRTDIDRVAAVMADEMTLEAGRDIRFRGVTIQGGDGDITLRAGHDVELSTVETSLEFTDREYEKKRTLFSSKKREKKESGRLTQMHGTLLAFNGNQINIEAGNQYIQTGSHIVAPNSTVNIQARQEKIEAAIETQDEASIERFKQRGITFSVQSPVLDKVNSVKHTAEAMGDVNGARLKSLGVVSAGLNGGSAINSVKNAIEQKSLNNLGSARLGYSQRSETKTHAAHREQVVPSSVESKTLNMVAAGGGQDSDIQIKGSHIRAKEATLDSEGAILLTSAQAVSSHKDTQKVKQGSLGVSVDISGAVSGDVSAMRQDAVSQSKEIVNHHTTVDVDGLTLNSGGDTTVKGAVVKAKGLLAEIGGELLVESAQDESHYTTKENIKSVGVSAPITGASIPSGSISNQRNTTDYHKVAVNTQSGFDIGADGYDINVAGGTTLVGGLLQVDDVAIQAGKAKLVTKTLDVQNIKNTVEAKANSSGQSIHSDMVQQGKYGASKAIVANTLLRAKAGDSDTSVTRTALSDGFVQITDEAAQRELTGRTADQTIAALNHDIEKANGALKDIDTDAVNKRARAAKLLKQGAYDTLEPVAKFANDVYIEKASKYELSKDADGTIEKRKIADGEKIEYEAASDGKVYAATNGIFNDVDAAAKYAMQHSKSDGKVYLIHFPQAEHPLAELMVAGFQKFFENKFWGFSEVAKEVDSLLDKYGEDGLHMDVHSRGSLTLGNVMESRYKDPDSKGTLINTTVSFFGPAYNRDKADEMLSYLQDRDSIQDPIRRHAMSIYMENHIADPIGRLIGGNAATGGRIPEGSSYFLEGINSVFGEYTVHNCYAGSNLEACKHLW
jgi:filamentous hemagglutinin family protein